ncbi:MAG TPA: PsiF family protein [Beijerinckiaceae bacterium]|jgi:hypothetical protein
MKPLLLPAGALLAGALAALPASGQPRQDGRAGGASRDALARDCDAQATAKKLSGVARGGFMSECLAGRPAEAPGAGAGAGRDDAQNLQRKEEQDAQFRKWNSAADRAMRSICAGCSQGQGAAARPRKAKARSRPPPDDDGALAGGSDDVD